MARSYCRVQILGYVGGDPKFKQLQNGTTTASIRVATNESYRKEGQVIEQSEWHRAVAFGKLAEFVRDKVRKGDRVLFDGKLHTFAWEDHDKGTSGEQTNIIISDLTLFDNRRAPTAAAPPLPTTPLPPTTSNAPDGFDEVEPDLSSELEEVPF